MLDKADKPLDVPLEPSRARSPSARLGFLRPLVQFALMALVLAGAWLAMQSLAASKRERTPRPFTPLVYTVETAAAERADNRPDIRLYGQVETGRNVDLRTTVSGDVVEIHPDMVAGRRVAEGTVLLRIDPFAYEGALVEARANLASTRAAIAEIDARLASEREQLEASEAQLELGRADLERALSLADSGALTDKEVDARRLIVSQREQASSQRRNNILIAEAQRTQQEANAERLEWKIREAQRRLEETALIAPFDGIISDETVETGRSVNANEVVASIYDDTALDVKFTLTNAQYGRMATDTDPLVGRQVELGWSVGGTRYTWPAVIDRIGARVTAERGGVEVFARIGEADNPVQLRPGAFVSLTVPDRIWPETFRLPETAVRNSDHVFVVVDGKLERRAVRLIAWDGEDAIVDGSLEDGDTVLVTRLTEATEGVRVREPSVGGAASDPQQPSAPAVDAGE
ncbi:MULTISPECIES: efflux RND transporter periplasmic adaptor subunit [Hoeflea]|uniref:Efflux RND transporter periplasmic adaptor subunit n=1 Tax=Hoeflea alexandrii TaxID=288436 RepID=A0ABT1CT71_9HYPH|nr:MULTISPECIES: efflux RND transporter periplasmic adaptor subunit [Hoeflea]MCO6409391.1 efflux RND transporter periplasmic adaptor subunit [Hoeflea alexandrii]MCY0151982.1 efflux RND transporter periplasmic adaptor subunit [Hoeflea alexandrii]VVT26452.1 Efflux transporter periplasmic adaptor subunit [Hoeflea sp. EC-HK425]